jgi:hypothetical protein
MIYDRDKYPTSCLGPTTVILLPICHNNSENSTVDDTTRYWKYKVCIYLTITCYDIYFVQSHFKIIILIPIIY